MHRQVKTNMFMHMSRSGEKERVAGKSIDGQIYNYEALDAGQNFRGEIIGGKMSAYIGRSKFTQYGKCLVTIARAAFRGENLSALGFTVNPTIPF